MSATNNQKIVSAARLSTSRELKQLRAKLTPSSRCANRVESVRIFTRHRTLSLKRSTSEGFGGLQTDSLAKGQSKDLNQVRDDLIGAEFPMIRSILLFGDCSTHPLSGQIDPSRRLSGNDCAEC
jgi:hypothetical protein